MASGLTFSSTYYYIRQLSQLFYFKRIFILAFLYFFMCFGFLQGQTTLYSYKTGSWNDPDTWTTDPSGTLLTGSQIPANNDIVIILSSRTVTLPVNISNTGLDITVNSGAILETGLFRFTNTLVALRGQGIIRLGSVNFPSATTNTFVASGGGTTEIINTSGTLAQNQFNHLIIRKDDNNATNYALILGNDININGDFTIDRVQGTGNMTVTVGNNAVVRNITVAGNLSLSTGSVLNTGNFNAIHTITLQGNLTNYGTIDLSNAAQYAASNTGAALFTFVGETDNNFICDGPADFYQLALNKGTDRTYILSVTSSNTSYFRLFGPVSGTGGDWSTLPLRLLNGTLKLRSGINIPVLGKDSGSGSIHEFHIPGTAGLWIDGATVATSNDGGGWRGITVYGLFRITSGTFTNPNNTGGITYFGNSSQPGYILIEGGTVNTTQVKQADVNGRVTYHQSGGRLNITGYSDSRGSSAVFALPTADFVFIMSGGSIYISGVNTTVTNGIDIRVSSSNYNVSGGSITVVRPSASDDQANFQIYSTAPFYNLTLKDTSATGTNLGYILQNDLVVLNNLAIQNRTLNAAGFNVTVGGNFSVGAGATYTPGTNTTTFNGSGNQTFTFNGTITSGLNNLMVNKSAGTLTFSRTTVTDLPVNGYLDLASGTLNDGGNSLSVYGNITNNGTHTGTGSIILVDNDPQTIGGDGNGIFGNLTLNNTDATAAPVSLTSDIQINGILNLANNKIFSISSYNLKIGSSGSISNYSANRYIATNGDIGDKGISKTFSSTSFVFPIGVIPGGARYTPTSINLSTAPSVYGTMTVIPVDAEQMQTSPNGRNRSLTYFWRVRSVGFSLGSANVTQTFTYSQSDVVTGAPQIDENSYVAARYNPSTFSWNIGTTGDVDETNNIINWPDNVSYIDGDYTAGDNTPQNPFGTVGVLYSYQSGDWRDNNVWMTDTLNAGSVTSTDPDANTPVMIRNGHTIRIDGNNRASGNLQIQKTGILNCGTYTGLNFGVVTNALNGSGTIRISSSAATATFPAGDFTEFRGQAGGTVEYYTTGTTNFTIPTTSAGSEVLSYYRHLILSPNTGQYITMPDRNLTLYGNMTVQGQSVTGIARLNTASTTTLSIEGNLSVTAGNLQFRSGQTQNINIQGNLTISAGAVFDVQNTGTTTNSIIIYSDLTNNGTLNFNPGTSSCDITFAGSTSASLTGSGNTTLRNLTVNKGSDQSTLLTVNVSGATFSTPVNNWLTLTNGTFRFMRTGDLNITTTSTFTIPSTAGLYVNNAGAVIYLANNNVNTNDVYLNGKLSLIAGTIYIGPSGATASNNDIEYGASGSSEIEIQGGTIIVNGQLRRSLTGTAGVLQYNQSGGAVTINGNNQNSSRAKLEIENDGSSFNMTSGTISIIRGGGTTYGDLYLRPSSGSVTGGTILFGTQNNGVQNFIMDANIPLNNLTINGVGGLNNVELMVNPLHLSGNLLINNTNSSLTSNNINVFVKGNYTQNGAYNYGTNTTTFNGSAQVISGSNPIQFYDMVVNSTGTVTLNNNLTINKDLTLSTGILSTGTLNANLKGDFINNASFTSDNAAGGVILNGTSVQKLQGNGTYGRLELNNATGARLMNDISLTQDFILTNGVFDINQFVMNLGVDCDIAGSGFNSSKMIKPDGVLSNIGIRKYFNSGSHSFTFPIGVSGKYTPADLVLNNSAMGSVRVNVINDHHPTVSDPNNVLQYYWEVESSGISNSNGNLILHYSEGDVSGTESDYVAARLVIPPGTDWSKASPGASTDNVDETADTILFDFPSGTTSLSGEYTAGTDAAIPDEVPVYTSKSDGNWDDVNIWDPQAPAGGPNGFIVIIRSSDSVSTNGNKRFAYHTTINGVLDVADTYGHNLGHVDGTGKLYLETPILPAGRFTSFFGCSGGTIEFGGTGSYTVIADRIDTVKNMFFSGIGTRILPDKDLVICTLLKISGPALDNGQYNRKLTLLGDIRRVSGSFSSGTGANATVSFKGSSLQQIGGTYGDFNGTNALNNLEIDNPAGLTLNGNVELKRNLLLSDGIINSTTANTLYMLNWNTSVIPDGGSSQSFVSGPLSKRIFEGDDFAFPVGKSTRFGKLVLSDVSDGDWIAEYYNTAPSNTTVAAPLVSVSSSEYWNVKGPAGKQAYVRLRWDALSDITPLTTQNGINDIRVAQYNAPWVAQSTSLSGNDYDGTAETTSKMNLDEHQYTLGSVSATKSRAGFMNTDDICAGENLQVSFSKTAGSYTFAYTIAGTPHTVTTALNPYTVSTTTPGRYKLTSFTGGVIDTNSVLVLPVPVATLTCSDADLSICSGSAVTFTAGGGTRYDFHVNGVSVQDGASTTFSTSSLNHNDVVTVIVYNASGCSDDGPSMTMTVNSPPIPSISGLQIACENEAVVYTTEGTGTSNYNWTVTGGSYTGETTNQLTVTWDAVTGQYLDRSITINYTDSHGCTAEDPSEIIVRVYRLPQTGPDYYIPNDKNK